MIKARLPDKTTLSIFSLTHLVVDFACFYLLMGSFTAATSDLQLLSLGFLTYNFIAFALQLPIGYLADRCHFAPHWPAITGCLLVMAGLLIPASAWLRMVICALGNAAFHIGGGIDSLVFARGRFSRAGIFISFGALGVSLGSLAGRSLSISGGFVVVLLGCCVAALVVFCRKPTLAYLAPFDLPPARIRPAEAVVLLSLIAIVIRAAVGTFTPTPWSGNAWLYILPALSVFIGKFSGGLLADKFGARPVVVVSLVFAAPLLAFANDQVILCCLGLFLFNTVTAITLCLIVAKIPNNPGLGFGLTTLALFLGSSFSYFVEMPSVLRPVLILAAIGLSTVCILLVAPARAKS